MFILSRAIQQSPNAILIARADGVIEYVNPSFTRLTGFTPEEVMGEDPPIGFGRGVSGQYRNLWSILREGRDWRGEIRDKKKNGVPYWALETITPISNPEGEITHFLVIRQDITQQKLDHKALEESEARFRQVAEMTGEWLWEQDAEGRYIYSSAAVSEILGYKPEEIIGKRYLDLLEPEMRAAWTSDFPALSELGQGFCRLMNCYLHRDGHRVYTESTGAPLFDAKGRLLKWRGVDHNVTSRKNYEDALRLRNRAIEAASVGICIVDATKPGYPNIYVNPALCRITGYGKEELIGCNMRILQGLDTDTEAQKKIRNAVRNGRGCEVTLKNYRKDGTPFWNELLIAPVWDENGKLTHFIGIQADITERRRAEGQRHELDIARKIQLSLLPKAALKMPGLQVYGVCEPASHVGGDYFDYFRVRDHVDMVIADVSGHSMGSALMMAETRSTLKAEARRAGEGQDQGPGATLAVINELLYEDLNGAEQFISMFYLRYTPRTRELRYASAGHNPPLLLRAGAPSCEQLDAEGLVLGVLKDVKFEEKVLTLAPGDRILLYTDGIVEARDETGEFFGIMRLCERFCAYREIPPQTAVKKILTELHGFTGEIEDDVTLLVARID